MEDITNYLPDEQDELGHYLEKYPRAMKLMRKDKNFIVIADDEPYYARVYEMIRHYEKHKRTWTEEDELVFREAVDKSKHAR